MLMAQGPKGGEALRQKKNTNGKNKRRDEKKIQMTGRGLYKGVTSGTDCSASKRTENGGTLRRYTGCEDRIDKDRRKRGMKGQQQQMITRERQ